MSKLLAPMVVMVCAGLATAQDEAPAATESHESMKLDEPPPRVQWPDLEQPGNWLVQIRPRAWYVSPSGEIKLPSSTTPGARVKVQDLNLDTPLVQAYGEFSIQFDRWRVGVSGFNNSIERGTGAGSDFQFGDVSVTAGDPIRTSFDFTSMQAQVGYRVYDYDFCTTTQSGEEICAALRLEAFGGGRYYDVDIQFASGGAVTRAENTFGEVFVGLKGELEILRDFSIEVETSVGGWSDSANSVWSIDAVIGLTWRPVDGVGLTIGWRQLAFDLSHGEGAGEFEYDGRVAGVFLGVDIRF